MTYYEGLGKVLAPRGWHCFGLYGSSGSILIITPEQQGEGLLRGQPKLTGPAVQLSMVNGETSGRFESAQIAARLFPSRKSFVERVIAEGLMPREAFVYGQFPKDTIRRAALDLVEFETPAHTVGMGTVSRLVPNGDPISGFAKMTENNDAYVIVVRLPEKYRDLKAVILKTALRDAEKN